MTGLILGSSSLGGVIVSFSADKSIPISPGTKNNVAIFIFEEPILSCGAPKR